MNTQVESLTLAAGGQTLTVVPGKTATIGRTADNDLTVNHPLVSRRHAVLAHTGESWLLTDRSTNGIFLDGAQQGSVAVRGPITVQLGDPRAGVALTLTPSAAVTAPPRPAQPAPRPPQQPPRRTETRQPRPQVLRPAGQRPPAPSTPTAPPPAQASSGFRPAAPRPSTQQRVPGAPAAGPSGPGAVPDPRPVGDLPPHLRAMAGNTGLYRVAAPAPQAVSGQAVSIGRTPDNDLVIDDMLVSRRHARVVATAQGPVLEDLRSANGTQVNGSRIAGPTPLHDGDVVTVGNSDLVLQGGALQRPQPHVLAGAGLVVRTLGLTVDGGKTLLRGVELDAAPGTLTAVIGPSGAGKSTVSRIVSGELVPTVGTVEFESRDVHRDYDALRSRIGMVPQDDVLHRRLTVRQALRYAAELRLPPDMSKQDRDGVIDGVLSELQLSEHAETRIDKLSGGQRKRASVAMELLTGPSLLILDEPTSGLDPALDRQVMQTLRRLADAGRVVIVVTHSLTHLDMCDQVLLLAPGGRTAYCGAPDGVGKAMGTKDWAEIFDFVARRPEEAEQRYRAANPPTMAQPAVRAEAPPVKAPRASRIRQLSVVARRQARLILADRAYLAFLVALPFVLGAITLIVPSPSGLRKIEATDDSGGPTIILVLMVIGACFMGAALTARELVGERVIYLREKAVGLRPGAYLAAKTLVFFVAAVLQSAVMTAIVAVGIKQPIIQGNVVSSPTVEIFVAVAATACVSVLVGLLISALARSPEQVMPLLVVVVMLQLVMSGGLFGLHGRVVLEQVSWLFPSRWGFAGAASTIDLQHVTMINDPRTGEARIVDLDPLWNHTRGAWLTAMGALVAQAVVLWVLVWSRIRRRVG
ncbi:ATP-binding cassette domain-containing protein [Tsukamurella sp. 8F]|uniref:FHA domain-containing protein n=1 Tax=unclassified Tsukamurella TaxID=2633480 RepID=UPI0023BA141C|nr:MULTISPECIES: FHA domain-containing protein [unclassified Tsukamurella]MDF0530539.1 ATP-binding cassette domain-containing protein [Tsukamurella sp. 8J]MDF0586811.1 ATP-binding cassette domain-containing protein [Tsukamurella sp. 8F]